MPAVKNVGEPCAGEPHARFEVAAGGNQTSRASTAARSRRLSPTLPSKWLRASLTEAAIAATRKKDCYLAAQYQRLRGRRGHARALTAVGHSILTAAWHMLKTGELYRDLGNDYFTRQDPDRLTRRLVRRLEALGHTVVLQAPEVAT